MAHRNCLPRPRVVTALVATAMSIGMLIPASAAAAQAQARPTPQTASASVSVISHELVAVTADSNVWARPPSLSDIKWSSAGSKDNVTGLAFFGGLLFASTTDNKLWIRPQVEPSKWTIAGHSDHPVSALTADGSRLYVLTTQGRLEARGPFDTQKPWVDIGAGPTDGATAIAVLGGRIWATTPTNKLMYRDVFGSAAWTLAGHANNVVALAALDGELWASTSDDKLWVRSPSTVDVYWTHVGHAIDVTEMTAVP